MPEGPLGFPRLTDLGPMVDSVEPHIDIDGGVYSMEQLEDIQPITAEDAIEFMDMVLRSNTPYNANFRYGQYSIEDIVVEDGFIPTLSRYVGEEPNVSSSMDKEDLSKLAAGFPHSMNREEAEMKAEHDIKRVNEIHDEIAESGKYWPPTFERGASTLDGAHRVAALYHFTGIQKEIHAWELINPDDV